MVLGRIYFTFIRAERVLNLGHYGIAQDGFLFFFFLAANFISKSLHLMGKTAYLNNLFGFSLFSRS